MKTDRQTDSIEKNPPQIALKGHQKKIKIIDFFFVGRKLKIDRYIESFEYPI